MFFVTAAAAVIFVLLGIGSPLVGQRVFLGTDLLQPIQPWRTGSEVAAPTNFCVSDTIDSGMPQRAQFRDRSWEGDFPLWDPYPNGGTTLGAVPSTAMLSPLNLPYLVLPVWLAPAIAKLVEASVAIGFTFLFLRRLGFSRPGSLLAGMVFASSAFLVVWTNWPHAHVAALVPALFWAVERFLQTRTVRAALPISVVAAVMLLEGFPAVTGWALYGLAAYFLVRSLTQHRRNLRRILVDGASVAGALALGLGVAALQVVPFLYQLPNLALAERAEASRGVLPRYALATLPDPFALGTCGAHGDPGYWGPPNDAELNSFIGVVALALAVVALVRPKPQGVRRGMRAFFAVAAGVCITLIYLGGPLRTLTFNLPIFDVNPIGRLRSMLGFFLACLTAVGFDMVLRSRRSRNGRAVGSWIFTGCVLAAAAIFAAVVMVQARGLAATAGHLADFYGSLTRAALLGALAVGAIVAAFALRGRWRAFALATLPVIALVQALTWVWPYWPRVENDLFYPETTAHDFLQENMGSDRFVSSGLALFPATGAMYGLRSAVGHSFVEQGWRSSLEAIDPRIFITRTFTALPPDPAIARSPMLDRLAARYYVAPADYAPLIAGGLRRTAEPAGVMQLAPGAPLETAAPEGDLRGIGVVLSRPAEGVGPSALLELELLDATGEVVARGERFVSEDMFPPDVVVPIPDEAVDPADGEPSTLRISLHSSSAPVELAADAAGAPVISVQDALHDGLRLVFSDGVAIYERTNSAARVHWASATRVIPDDEARLDYLAGAPVVLDEVVLSEAGPDGDGRPGRVEIEEDSGDIVRVSVDADGSGYVVVMDALAAGWVAEVDGRPADLVDADQAGGAVFVDEGRHEVVLTYVPPGWRVGVITSAVALGVLAALWLMGDRILAAARRRGRARSTSVPGPSSPGS